MKSSYCYIAAILLLFTACKKATVNLFNSSSDIYFNYASTPPQGTSVIQFDTVFVSFALRKDSAFTVTVPVNVLGNPSGSKRLYAMAVSGNAIAGKHYKLPVPDSLYIHRNLVRDSFKVSVFRPADLRDTAVTLLLELKPNNNFTTNMQVYNYAANPVLNATRLKITVNDILPQPANWALSVAYLGTYSRKKLELMVAAQNLVLQKFYYTPLYTSTSQNTYAKTMQIYLNAQKAAGHTVYEKDGTEMKMGPSAQ